MIYDHREKLSTGTTPSSSVSKAGVYHVYCVSKAIRPAAPLKTKGVHKAFLRIRAAAAANARGLRTAHIKRILATPGAASVAALPRTPCHNPCHHDANRHAPAQRLSFFQTITSLA